MFNILLFVSSFLVSQSGEFISTLFITLGSSSMIDFIDNKI